MKWILFVVFWLGMGMAEAQNVRPLVRVMSWDEASMAALKERKMVFVAVGVNPGDKTAAELFADECVRLFLERNAVGLGMDMESEDGRFFEQKLLMYPWPSYAFFMPYGDLLAIVPVAEVAGHPARLVEVGREALKKAEIKKSNSRSVKFREENPEDLLSEAESSGKLVFVMGIREKCQACLLMQKNVLNLDRVADFYNRHFICTQADVSAQAVAQLSSAEQYPFWLFLNGEGKVVLRAEGQMDEEHLLALGQKALKKSEGIVFEPVTPGVLIDKAAKEDKFVFLDFFTPAGAERKQLEQKIFRDPEVAAFFETHFLSGSYNMLREEGKLAKEKYAITLPQFFCFIDSQGNLLHVAGTVGSPDELLVEALRAINGKGLTALQERYRKGERNADFIKEYLEVLRHAGMLKDAGEVASVYLEGVKGSPLRDPEGWNMYYTYVTDAASPLFSYLRGHRKELGELFGLDLVNRKIQEVWEAGARNFVKETSDGYYFEEAGFKEYVKLLRKEKVEGWRNIVRNARMEAAEKTGDWRTYTELAEERWNEETIPEAELYSWGVKINENCRDKSIRFKAARWFALAAVEIEKKERLTGKINLTSYKGFFENLVDELVK